MAEHSQLSLDRRATLGLLGLSGAAVASCGSGARAAAACLASPRETRGPFAADGGSDGGGRRNILEAEGVIRGDIRSSFAGLDGIADGVPLDLSITIVGVAGGCNTMAGW